MTAWLTRAVEPPPDALTAALTRTDGSDAGFLAVWETAERPSDAAVQVDPRLIDPAAGPAVASLTWVGRARMLFDDPAVAEARRRVLAGPAPPMLTSFLDAPSHFAGALLAAPGTALGVFPYDDPFARLGRNELLRVGPGLLGGTMRLAGPSLERYGARAWPGEGFA